MESYSSNFWIINTNEYQTCVGGWIQRMNEKDKKLLFVGMGALFWLIWLSRNDIVFNKTPTYFICRLYLGQHIGQERGRCFKRKKVKGFSACQLMEL
jgi:hypothetical protein